MKMNFKIMAVALFCVFALSLTSCQTKQHAIVQLENLSNDLRDNSEYYRLEDWKNAVNQFQKIRKNIGKHDYTPAERKQIGKLEGQCAGYFATGLKKNITNGIMGIGSEIKGMIEGVLNAVSESGISF
jgi:hypothetical protein